jgi:CBS domain-containing protein
MMKEIKMKVKDIMNKKVETLKPQDSIQSAARKMKSKNTSFIFIKEKNKLVGIVTGHDIVQKGIAKGARGTSLKLKDIMTKKIHSCLETDTIKTVAQSMAKNQVHRLPVLNKSKQLVGLLSIGHIALHSEQEAGKAIRYAQGKGNTKGTTKGKGKGTGGQGKTKSRTKTKTRK